ncbi:MAG: EAL domain-containing protein [Actinobacteria bacterium]|nr:MAG: EAL domain-containing protein [Actinomycetota bacterium]
MRNRLWLVYVAIASVATLGYFATGHVSYVINVIGLSSPVMIVVALRIWRPEKRLPWVMFSLGMFTFILGDIVSYNYDKFHSIAPSLFPFDADGLTPFPGWADGFYLAVYVFMVAGILLLIHARDPSRDRSSFVDALMLSIGIGVVSWVILISPQAYQQDVPLSLKLTSMAYPLADLLLLGTALRSAVGAGRKPWAFRLIITAIVALFITDAFYAWMNLYTDAGYQPGSGYLEAGWIAFYVLFGAAALHPSMRELSEPVDDVETKLTRGRLLVLAGASLMAPVLIAYEGAKGESTDHVRHEQALREAGMDLVTATNRDSIHAAAGRAVLALTGDDVSVRIFEQQEVPGELVVVAAPGSDDRAIGTSVRLSEFDAWKRERLQGRHAYQVTLRDDIADMLELPEAHRSLFVAPLFMRDELRGLLVVSAIEELPRQDADSLQALSAQVALALESAALTEDLLIQQSQMRFASLVKNSSDVVMVTEPDTTIRYASPSAHRVLGFEPEELEGRRFAELIAPDDRTRALSFLTAMADGEGHVGLTEYRVRHRDGTDLFVETLRTNLLKDPNVKGIVLNTRDISERKQFEEQLSHQAFHDQITGLANRALFQDRVSHALERQTRDGNPVAVLFMDLDDFKTINDSLGHAAGDQLLVALAGRLVGRLRTADTAARLGGDEFAVLLEDGGDEGMTAADVAGRILETLEEPFDLDGTEVYARASIGISVADPQSPVGSADELLRNADVAMYMAKEGGKARYQLFEPAMHDTALRRLELRAAMQRAIDHDEFRLFYQPVIELPTGKITGVEALIRWFDPEKGIIPPLDFIPLAEETGLIVPIGRWVLMEACKYAARLAETFAALDLHMAVNLSARQIARPEIVDEVREALTASGLDPGKLVLEITESVMIHDMDLAIGRLKELKTLGVQLAIDDFGTGYSSLNYVRRFPVDILKVDKSFIDGVTEGGESSALTAAVIELASILNLKPVAEGIERADQLEQLIAMKCDLGQGFLFAKPLPTDELEDLVTEHVAMRLEADALADRLD